MELVDSTDLRVVDTHSGDERWMAHLSRWGPVDFHQGPLWFAHLQHLDTTARALLVLKKGQPVASAVFWAGDEGWTCWRGPVGEPDPQLLERMLDEIMGGLSVTLVANAAWEVAADAVAGLTHVGDYTTNLLALECDDNKFLTRMSPTARNRSRRAARLGVTVEVGAHALDSFVEMYHSEMRRVESPDEATSEEMSDLCLKRGALLLTAWYEGQLAAGAVALDYGGTLEMRYVATAPHARRAAPMNLVYVEAMRWGREHGRMRLDVSGIATGVDLNDRTRSVNHFKLGFGETKRCIFMKYRLINGGAQ